MSALEHLEAENDLDIDQRVILHGVPWKTFEHLLAVRGDCAGPRIAYLDGELEFMSPSSGHEDRKTLIARLIEVAALILDFDLYGYGAWTLKKSKKKTGVEPDECYVVGRRHSKVPDLAIEVVWTHGGLDKLEIYRRLGVREVWVWIEDQIHVFVLRGERYARATQSKVLPMIDLAVLAKHVRQPDQARAVRAYARALRRSTRLRH